MGEEIMTSNMFGRRAVLGLSAVALAAGMLGLSAPARAADVTIPVIVKDTTSFYWQIVLAGARAAGKDLGVNVPELGAQSEADILLAGAAVADGHDPGRAAQGVVHRAQRQDFGVVAARHLDVQVVAEA